MATMQGSAQKVKNGNYFRARLTAPAMLTCEPPPPLSAGSELKPPPLLTEVKTTYLTQHGYLYISRGRSLALLLDWECV